tara:strand:- start:26 stop:208 length:183 start_codon:yes stop_codon:yes gene_type:complete
MIIYLLWLLLVVLWNFGVPGAAPFEDVVMAIIIGFVAYMLKKILQNPTILKKNKYFGNKK